MNLSQKLNVVFRSFGYHVKPIDCVFGYRRNELIKTLGIDLVIDVGANEGQYGDELRRYGYKGNIYSFEPLSSAYAALKARAESDDRWTAFRGALGDSTGTAQINISNNSQSSSLLPMLDSHIQAAPESKYVATEEVPLCRLDEEWSKITPNSTRVLLKLDTQGYEPTVLRGASGVLSKVSLIQCELSLIALYDGQPLLNGMLEILDNLSFEPVDFDPVFFDPKTRRCLQLDGLFAKKIPQ